MADEEPCAADFVDAVPAQCPGAINLGSSELVSINQLVDITEGVAGIKVKRNYNLSAPKGVNGRNSDNSLIKHHLGLEPSIRLRDGIERTYPWIYDQVTSGQPALVSNASLTEASAVSPNYIGWVSDSASPGSNTTNPMPHRTADLRA